MRSLPLTRPSPAAHARSSRSRYSACSSACRDLPRLSRGRRLPPSLRFRAEPPTVRDAPASRAGASPPSSRRSRNPTRSSAPTKLSASATSSRSPVQSAARAITSGSSSPRSPVGADSSAHVHRLCPGGPLGLCFAPWNLIGVLGGQNTERHRICAIDGDDMARRRFMECRIRPRVLNKTRMCEIRG